MKYFKHMVKDKLFCRFWRRGSARSFQLRKEAEEETRGKEWKVKVIERAGIKLAHQVPVGIQLLCSQHQQVELIMCIEVFLLSDLRVESENV